MQKPMKGFLFALLTLTVLLTTAFGATFFLSRGHSAHAAFASPSASKVTVPQSAFHTVNMATVPAATAQSLSASQRALPLLGVRRPVQSGNAPRLHNPMTGVNTPTTTARFQGMSDSATICSPGGCQPPDMALAASPNWVFEGVNTSFAVYSTRGAHQPGWPKSAQKFFGVPNPGSCDPNGPYLTDPRAFYDPTDGRFWAAELQVEGAFGLNNCPEKTLYWIAVSKTNNPTGAWNVYTFNMALNVAGSCPTCAADYTQFGFDQTAIYFSGNMFTQDGSAYDYAEMYSVLKSTMEAGNTASAFGLFDFQANGVLVDTVQPVENEAATGPGVGLLINSFNINGDGSHDCVVTACSGIVVWAIKNPGMASISVSGVVASSSTYITAPLADEPGCSACIETLDPRISGTPVYQNGVISFALETGANNGTQTVPTIFWGQATPTISSGIITGATVTQSGYFGFTGDQAASFGALMETTAGKLLMVFDTMSHSVNPGIMYTTRLTTDPPGTFETPRSLKTGGASTTNSRWGDYEATSYDGGTTNNTWFAAQFSAVNHDWSTYIGKVHF